MKRLLLMISSLLFLSAACSFLAQETSTPAIKVDSFYFGRAYLDTNRNGKLDPEDPPLEGAIFTATDARGLGSGGITDGKGHAMAWWPAESRYPVKLRMKPPKGKGYTHVTPEEVQITTGGSADFLFVNSVLTPSETLSPTSSE